MLVLEVEELLGSGGGLAAGVLEEGTPLVLDEEAPLSLLEVGLNTVVGVGRGIPEGRFGATDDNGGPGGGGGGGVGVLLYGGGVSFSFSFSLSTLTPEAEPGERLASMWCRCHC